MKRILAATDGSETSLHAVEVAGDLARRLDAELVVLAVRTETVETDEGLQEFARSEHLHATSGDLLPILQPGHLDAAELRAMKAGARHVCTVTRLGDPARQIVEQIHEGAFDLVVMGSRGLGPLAGLLLGSVSQKVASQAPCPVLIVPPGTLGELAAERELPVPMG